MHRDQLRDVQLLTRAERRQLQSQPMEPRPTLDQLRAMTAAELAAVAVDRAAELADFWQLTGMIAVRLEESGEHAFSKLVMDCGRAFDLKTMLAVCRYLAPRGDKVPA